MGQCIRGAKCRRRSCGNVHLSGAARRAGAAARGGGKRRHAPQARCRADRQQTHAVVRRHPVRRDAVRCFLPAAGRYCLYQCRQRGLHHRDVHSACAAFGDVLRQKGRQSAVDLHRHGDRRFVFAVYKGRLSHVKGRSADARLCTGFFGAHPACGSFYTQGGRRAACLHPVLCGGAAAAAAHAVFRTTDGGKHCRCVAADRVCGRAFERHRVYLPNSRSKIYKAERCFTAHEP